MAYRDLRSIKVIPKVKDVEREDDLTITYPELNTLLNSVD